jgi:hypothetical protein
VIGITNERHGESICHPGSPDTAAKAAACVGQDDVSGVGDLDRVDGRAGETSRQAARLLGQCGVACARGTLVTVPFTTRRTHRQAEPLRL